MGTRSPGHDRPAQRDQHLGLADRAFLEVLREEIIVGLGGGLGQLLAVGAGGLDEIGRDLGLLDLTQLTQKGLTKTDADTADLAVAYQVAIDQEKQWSAMGGGLGGLRFGGMGTATSSTISNGTLVLDIYELASKKQIWTGDATKTLNPSKDPQKNMANLQKAIAKLMKNYPPPSK